MVAVSYIYVFVLCLPAQVSLILFLLCAAIASISPWRSKGSISYIISRDFCGVVRLTGLSFYMLGYLFL